MDRRKRLSGAHTAPNCSANILKSKDILFDSEEEKELEEITKDIDLLYSNNVDSSDVEAIDNLSSLLIDISASIAKHDMSNFSSKMEECDTISLLEKLRSSELVQINEALGGWKSNPNILAPNYKPSIGEINALYNLIHNNKSIPRKVLKTIIKNKACATNFQNFVINGKTEFYNSNFYKKQSDQFIHDLKHGIMTLDRIFEKVKLSKQEINLFHLFVSKTASILFNLGFADSINHSAEVARKCVIESYRNNLSKIEILQSAMVGWIHDPKLPGNYSWSNLSTHPVIASAIALDVLTAPDMQKQIIDYIKDLNLTGKHQKNNEVFVKGIVEAVAINNDSKFVLDNAIFTRPDWAPGLPESGGVIDQVSSMSREELAAHGFRFDSEDLIHNITEIALDRFYAPSNMKKPASFNIDLLKVLKIVQIETGLIGIVGFTFKTVCDHLTGKYEFLKRQSLLTTFDQVLSGEIKEQDFLTDLSSCLQHIQMRHDNVYVSVKVAADKLFSHHDEMKYAPYAALTLAVADRLLLSPHKILEAGVQSTALGRILSFMASFKDNVKTLPKNAQHGGKIFQRDLYVSLLNTADELTGQNNYNKFEASLIGLPKKYFPFKTVASEGLNYKNIRNQVEYLEYLIKDPANWYDSNNKINYGGINPKDTNSKEVFQTLLKAVKNHYDENTEQSPEMFGFIKLKKISFIDKLLTKL